MNRATAAREFRVFHAALHSLNSAYRDSVSKGDADIFCHVFKEDPNSCKTTRSLCYCYFFCPVYFNLNLILMCKEISQIGFRSSSCILWSHLTRGSGAQTATMFSAKGTVNYWGHTWFTDLLLARPACPFLLKSPVYLQYYTIKPIIPLKTERLNLCLMSWSSSELSLSG